MKKLFLLLLSFSIFHLTLSQTPPRKELGNLVMENVPDIPQELMDDLDKWQNARSASVTDWTPDGQGLLITTRFADVPQIHLVNGPGIFRRQLTFFKEPVTFALTCPDKTKNGFAFSKDNGGNENYQWYWFDLQTSQYMLLTDGKSRNVNFTWNKTGNKFAYKSNKDGGKGMEIYVQAFGEPKTDEKVLKQADKGDWNIFEWNDNGTQLLVQKEISVTESYLFVLNMQHSNEMVQINEKPGKEISYVQANFSKDGKGIYLICDEDAEFAELWYYDIISKKMTALTKDIPWDVTGFEMNDAGTKLAFITNEDGYSKLYLMDTQTNKYQRVEGMPLGTFGGMKFNRDNKQLAINIGSAVYPNDVFVMNTEAISRSKESFPEANKQLLRRWTYSELGGIDESKLVAPELIHYPTFDSVSGKVRMIPAFMYKPATLAAGAKGFPVLINIHGGPEGQSLPVFSPLTQYMVSVLGMAVIFPNVRGSTGYGKTYVKLDNGFLRESSVRDIGSLIDWIGKQKNLDKDRVAVLGGSYGGYMSLATMTHFSSRMRLGIDVVGISNFVTFLKNTSEYRRDLRRVEYGDERDPKMNEFQQKISPNNNVDKITRPMFIIQGKNDPRVPVTEAEQMVEALKKNKTPVWYLMAKDEGHGFQKKSNRDFQNAAMILFMKNYLLN